MSGGSQNVSGGGSAYSTTVSSFGRDVVALGGLISGATVQSGGFESVGPGGTALGTTLLSGAVQALDGGTASAIVVEGGAYQIVSGNPDIPSAVSEADASIVENGGIEIVYAAGMTQGTTIAGGTLDLQSGALVSGGITFTGSGGALVLDAPTVPDAVLSGFITGDTVVLPEVAYSAGDTVGVTSPGIVTISAGTESYALHIAGAEAGVTDFIIGPAGDGLALAEAMACFAAGTHILTPAGPTPVEALQIGTPIITLQGEDAPLRWLGRRQLDLTRHSAPARARPIRIAAQALADGVPSRDLLLSPDHALHFDGYLIPAKALLNGITITQPPCRRITYHHLEFDAHTIIFAEHAAVESYLDTGNRGMFENAAGPLALHPDFAVAQALRLRRSCLPFTEDLAVVARVRRQIWHRSAFVADRTG